MDKRINIYITLTEYQFLQSVNIATGEFYSSDYINIIYIVRSGSRLKSIEANENHALDNLQLHIIENRNIKDTALKILKEDPDHFFIFQGNSPLNVYLAHKFSKKGVEISIGPDGYASYSIYQKENAFLTLAKDSIIANFYLLKNKMFSGKMHRFDYYKYGHYKFIDNIWLTHPQQYIHRGNNKANILELPKFNKKCIQFITKCFNFNETFPMENVIYYFNQPLIPELIETELNFLEGVFDNFPDRKIILKLHPLTSEKTKVLYQTFEQLIIINSLAPAELILLNLNNCIVFTGWSSVLMMENSSCNYYFNYPIYKKTNIKWLRQSDLIILDHITLVDRPELMKFPNE